MKKIGTAELFAGRKRMRALLDNAMTRAAQVRNDPAALERARGMLRFHAGLKRRHLDSLIVCEDGRGGYTSAIVLKDVPRGMPNIIGAAGENMSEVQATVAGRALLEAACMMVLDHKDALSAGAAEAYRRFEYGPLAFGVPEEIVSVVGNRMPVKISEPFRQQVLATSGAGIHALIGKDLANEEAWAAFSDDRQVAILVEAARLLCIGVNTLDAA